MKNIFMILTVTVGLSSCTSWLDVQPKTSIPGEDLFKSELGFKDALTGLYIKMGDESLYAKDLTYGFVDYLSCLYDCYPDFHFVKVPYAYDEQLYLSRKNAIYGKMYNIIANVNNFLFYLEKNRNVVKTKSYYEMMRGEALGLRAFLHFDLLRLFGPVYSVAPEEKSIAYRTSFDADATPLLSARELVDRVLADLHEADTLLEKHDTRFFDYMDETSKEYADQFTTMRQLRMNTFAVKALLARVYCYKGDEASKGKAVEYAEKVLADTRFALYKKLNDPVFFGEFIFGLNVYELNKIVDANFRSDVAGATQSAESFVCCKEASFNALYDMSAGGNSDFRASEAAFSSITLDNELYKFCRKYDQNLYTSDYWGRNMLPLIRVPEMYYIIAECSNDKVRSAEALNTIRWARGISYDDEIYADDKYDRLDTREGYDQTKTVRVNELMKEYRKEFYGEGQLFYCYKRLDYKTFDRCPLNNMSEKYKLPIPDNEKIFGNNK